MLTRLIYASTSTRPVEVALIESILESARVFNGAHQITGMLCESAGKFIQYIEGDRASINELYNKLLNDKRHENLVLLDYSTIEVREYADWSMGFISMRDKRIQGLVAQTINDTNFEPDKLTSEQAVGLIKTLKAEVSTQLPSSRGQTTAHGR